MTTCPQASDWNEVEYSTKVEDTVEWLRSEAVEVGLEDDFTGNLLMQLADSYAHHGRELSREFMYRYE